jgi:hypothetical protein
MAIIKLITASIRETSGFFLYKTDIRITFTIRIHNEIRLGINTPQGGASLGCPQGSWLKTGKYGGRFL